MECRGDHPNCIIAFCLIASLPRGVVEKNKLFSKMPGERCGNVSFTRLNHLGMLKTDFSPILKI